MDTTNHHTLLDRSSHDSFLRYDRDFTPVQIFWSNVIKSEEIPSFVAGTEEFGVTNLQRINEIGSSEFDCKDPRYSRKTFALRIGYDGSKYNGYQKQSDGVSTVEKDLCDALDNIPGITAAGRTDKGVSAVSQIISFKTYDSTITPETIMRNLKSKEPFLSHKLNIWDCVRVPRKFNALFSAVSRRYIYLFPLRFIPQLESKVLSSGNAYPYDVDVDFVCRALTR